MRYSFFILFTFSIIRPQTLPLELARLYAGEKNYAASINEYNRHLFFNKRSSNNTKVLIELYNCYKATENWPKALVTVEKAYLSTNSDSTKDIILTDKAVILMSKGESYRAEMILTRISTFTKYKSIKNESFYWLGLCHLFSYKWLQAKNNFHKYYGKTYKQQIDSMFARSSQLDIKSPQKARVLSFVIPGLGQFYSKDYKNGINSLILNLLTSCLFFNSLIEKNYFDAIIIYYIPFERYYWGSSSNAELIAQNYNHKTNQKFANSVLESIANIQN